MKSITKRYISVILSFVLCFSMLFGIKLPVQSATVDYVYAGNYIKNWGTREEVATYLSQNAEAFYEDNDTSYAELSALSGSSSTSSVPSSSLYKELQSLMKSNHTVNTSYGEARYLFEYTDCQNSGKTSSSISSFYSGISVGPEWDSGKTWNREHTWPKSKTNYTSVNNNSVNEATDIMSLRPTASSENSSRGNKAYGTTTNADYFNPNNYAGDKYDLRGDCARIMLYVYVRWGNTGNMWGASGVMQSKDVLIEWMEADPVDTWELGRNDSVESITGTRNVFVDYPELAFVLFDERIPDDYTTPSGNAANGGGNTGDDNTGDNNTGDDNIGDDTTTTAPTVVDTPVANTAYKFGMVQENVSTTDVYYLAGGMDGYYMASTSSAASAIDVYLEETTGGYYLYTMVDGVKTYINMVVSGTHVNGAYEATASTVYTYDADAKTVVATVNDALYWFGTRNDKTYTTVGPCATSYNGFYCKFYTLDAGEDNTGGGSDVVAPGSVGDVNDDGVINNKDLGIFMQYLNDWDVVINLSAADVNVDGSVNNKDYGLLMQYCNGWDVVLGTGTESSSPGSGSGSDSSSGSTSTLPLVTDQEKILADAFALEENETTPYIAQLTGKVVSIDSTYDEQYGSITVTIVVDGKNIQCYKMKGTGADKVAVNDTITVKGVIKNYFGTVEFAWDAASQTEVIMTKRISGGGVIQENDPAKIMADAYALASGQSLGYEVTLEGKVTSIKNAYDAYFGNITVVIEVAGKSLDCFRMVGDGIDAITVGDTITVTGTIKNYNGTIEFDAGCTMRNRISGGVVAPTDPKEIVDAAFALEPGKSLPYSVTLTGEIIEINTVYDTTYKNITVTIEVEGTDDVKALKCYRLRGDGADALAVGDTITVTGVIKNYQHSSGNCEVEFDAGCTLDSYVKNESGDDNTTEEDNGITGKAYKFGMVQENVSTTDVYYLAGGMSSYYMSTTTDAAVAIDVYLEETDGGYYLYTTNNGAKTYINMVTNGTHVNGAYEATASTVYTYDEEKETIVATVNDELYWFGTRNDKTYTTVGPCKTSYEGFYCKFYQ